MRVAARPSFVASVAFALVVVGGCGDDSRSDEGSGTGDGSGGSGEGSDGGSDGGTDQGEPVENEPARAVVISRVEANHGVAVPIAENGQWVGAGGRNAEIVKNRDTLIRVFVDVDDEVWIEREIEARLELGIPDGSTEIVEEVALIEGDSTPNKRETTFNLGVLAKQMIPGTTFQVTLWEVWTGFESLPEVEEAPKAIAAGPGQIGIESGFQEMKLVIVPIDYSYGDCTAITDTSEEYIERYADLMFEMNPLESIQIEIHSPIQVRNTDLTNTNGFNSLASQVAQLRASDAPAPNVYYYGLLDICGACVDNGGGGLGMECLLGVARGIPGDSQGEASQRSAIGVTRMGTDESKGPSTFVHEVGHTQGRQHVECPGVEAGGPDPSYPYPNGQIGVWGFGIRSFRFFHPTATTDYMSYCNPAWASDWQWRATYQRIRTLSSWDARTWNPGGKHLLIGDVDPSTGKGVWWTAEGFLEDHIVRSADHRVAFRADGRDLKVDAAKVDPWTDGVDMITVTVPLPPDFATTVDSIRYEDGEHESVVPAEDIVLVLSLRAR